MAIDDEPLALQQIAAYIQKVPFLELAAQCQSALEARSFLERDTVDAIFCDINMPDLNGMDFVKSLANPVLVVFTTAYSEYAVEDCKTSSGQPTDSVNAGRVIALWQVTRLPTRSSSRPTTES